MASTIITPQENLALAAARLREGELVAFPTETVYGLGADATRSDSVAKIFAMKQRPTFNPLIIHALDKSAAQKLGKFNSAALALAQAFWEKAGGLTLVVPKAENCPICPLALAGGETIALRVPAHPIARALLKQSGLFLAAPSANPSGKLSPTKAEHVARLLGEQILILDGGATDKGLESTIIGCLPEGNFLLRSGAVPSAEIEKVLGSALNFIKEPTGKKLSSGRLLSHYAPNAKLRLNATQAKSGEGFLAFGKTASLRAHPTGCFNLSESGDLAEAAHNFFSMLHEMDRLYDAIAVAPIPNEGLGIAINDRLRRAAFKPF